MGRSTGALDDPPTCLSPPPNNSSFPDFSPHILDEMRCKTGNTFSLFFFPYCVILIEAGDDRFTPHISTNFFPPIVYRGEYNLSSPRLNFRSNVSEQNQMELTTTRMTNDSCNCGRSIIFTLELRYSTTAVKFHKTCQICSHLYDTHGR